MIDLMCVCQLQALQALQAFAGIAGKSTLADWSHNRETRLIAQCSHTRPSAERPSSPPPSPSVSAPNLYLRLSLFIPYNRLESPCFRAQPFFPLVVSCPLPLPSPPDLFHPLSSNSRESWLQQQLLIEIGSKIHHQSPDSVLDRT